MVTASATPTRKSTARDSKTVVLERLAGEAYAALSSDGQTWYRVEWLGDGWACSCTGYTSRQRCCHSLAAALPRCYWCLSTTDVQTFSNGSDHGAEISLCGACLTATIPENCAEHRSGCNGRHSA